MWIIYVNAMTHPFALGPFETREKAEVVLERMIVRDAWIVSLQSHMPLMLPAKTGERT